MRKKRREAYAKDPSKFQQAPEKRRQYKLKATYGLTPQVFESLFDAQGRRCACCRRPDPGYGKGWCVDHDHVTNKIRGIICNGCNRGLGLLGDSLESVANANHYLHRHHNLSTETVDEHY